MDSEYIFSYIMGIPLSDELSESLKRDYNRDIKEGDYSVEIKDIEESEDCSTIKVEEELGNNNIEVNNRVVEKPRYHIFFNTQVVDNGRIINFFFGA